MSNRNEPTKRFTHEQMRVATWIRELGFAHSLEAEFGDYWVDIYVAELNLAIELDGPYHFSSRDNKRDAFLMGKFGLDIWRFKNNQIIESFKSTFVSYILEKAAQLEKDARGQT